MGAYDNEVITQMLEGVAQGAVVHDYKASVQADMRPVLLITTVDIGGGRSERIEIRQGDRAEDAAQAFCDRHGLPSSIVEPLTRHIEDNLAKAVEAKASAVGDSCDGPLTQRSGVPGRITEEVEGDLEEEDTDEQQQEEEEEEFYEEEGLEEEEEHGSEAYAGEGHDEAPRGADSVSLGSEASGGEGRAQQAGRQASGAMPGQPLTFSGPLSARALEQLESKLMHVDPTSNPHLLSVGSHAGSNGGGPYLLPNAQRPAISQPPYSSGSHAGSIISGGRITRSAGVSPRDARVYNRLYSNAVDMRTKQEARRKMQAQEMAQSVTSNKPSISWISREMMRNRNHGPFDNYGEMLYAEGLEAAALRKSKAEAVRSEREAKELEGASFQPAVTELARALWGEGNLGRNPVWQRLSNINKAKMLERIEGMRKAREDQEVRECTFRPRINNSSAAMMSERADTLRALNISAHEQLYQDSLRRKQKAQELANWYPEGVTFKPAVNKSAMAESYFRRSLETFSTCQSPTASPAKSADPALRNSNAGSLSSVRTSNFTLPKVVDRLYAAHARVQAKKEEKKALLHGEFDPTTGRQLFKPEVGRGPRSGNGPRPEGVPVHEALYTHALELLNKKEAQVEAEKQAAHDEAARKMLTAKSEQMFRQLKERRFSQVFDYLDEARVFKLDLVGLVRQPTQRMDNLDGEVREDVELAAEVLARQHNVKLHGDGVAAEDLPDVPPVDVGRFHELMEAALTLRRGPRSYLVPSPSGKTAPEHSFRPAINKKSKELAQRMRPADLPTHELLYHQSEATRAKIEAKRKETHEAELDGCTFQPQLNTNSSMWHAEGRAMRSVGATASRDHSTPSSPRGAPKQAAARPRQNSGGGGGRPPARAPQQQQAAGAVQAQQQEQLDEAQLLALEHEVQEALAGVEAGHAVLNSLASERESQGDVCNDDLRQTEAMLMDLLKGDCSDPEAEAAALDKLSSLLQRSSRSSKSSTSGAPPAQSVDGDREAALQLRASKASVSAEANMLCVAEASIASEKANGLTMQALARSLGV